MLCISHDSSSSTVALHAFTALSAPPIIGGCWTKVALYSQTRIARAHALTHSLFRLGAVRRQHRQTVGRTRIRRALRAETQSRAARAVRHAPRAVQREKVGECRAVGALPERVAKRRRGGEHGERREHECGAGRLQRVRGGVGKECNEERGVARGTDDQKNAEPERLAFTHCGAVRCQVRAAASARGCAVLGSARVARTRSRSTAARRLSKRCCATIETRRLTVSTSASKKSVSDTPSVHCSTVSSAAVSHVARKTTPTKL